MRNALFTVIKWPSSHRLCDAMKYGDEGFRVEITVEKSGCQQTLKGVQITGLRQIRQPEDGSWYDLWFIVHNRIAFGDEVVAQNVEVEARVKLKAHREQGYVILPLC